VTVQQSEHLSPISNLYTQKQWRFNKVNILLLSQIIMHKNSDGSIKWTVRCSLCWTITVFVYNDVRYEKDVDFVEPSLFLCIMIWDMRKMFINHYTQKQWRFNKVNIFLISHIIIHKNSDGSTKWTSYSYLKSLYIKTIWDRRKMFSLLNRHCFYV
jgi:hypothetical protein